MYCLLMNHWFLSCLCFLFLPTDSWTRYHRRPVEQENQHKASCIYPDGTIYKEKARQEKVKDDIALDMAPLLVSDLALADGTRTFDNGQLYRILLEHVVI